MTSPSPNLFRIIEIEYVKTISELSMPNKSVKHGVGVLLLFSFVMGEGMVGFSLVFLEI